MRSTGEGISIAASLEEALRKAFHVGLKEKKWNTVVVSTLMGSKLKGSGHSSRYNFCIQQRMQKLN